jgi:hypothetical protein
VAEAAHRYLSASEADVYLTVGDATLQTVLARVVTAG